MTAYTPRICWWTGHTKVGRAAPQEHPVLCWPGAGSAEPKAKHCSQGSHSRHEACMMAQRSHESDRLSSSRCPASPEGEPERRSSCPDSEHGNTVRPGFQKLVALDPIPM